jgi:hypothetical protein
LHILHYGFDGKYLPIGFDVLFIKILKNMAFFRRYFAFAISTRVSLVMIVKSCYSKIVASMAWQQVSTPAWMRFDSSGDC